MHRVVVIGGGLSGLSSAVFLAEKNIPVILIESAGRLGGRVSSYYDPYIKAFVDNGQHIMMGCYTETLDYLRIINALDNFSFQKNLEVVFYRNRRSYPLKGGKGIYPLNMLSGLLSFKLLNIKDRISLIKFFLLLPVSSKRDIEKLSAEQWLIEMGQSDELRRTFWDTFIVGALNTTSSKASALILRDILFRVFLSGKRSSALIIPAKPLTEAFCAPAVEYLTNRNSEMSLSERVLKLEADPVKNKIRRIVTTKRVIEDFDYIISAIPPFSLNKIIKNKIAPEFTPVYSSILSVHFRTGEELFGEDFIAVLDSPIHWIFRHKEHYTIVISSADELSALANEKIIDLIKREINRILGISELSIGVMRVIKEKRATFVPAFEVLSGRPGNRTGFNNLVLAGDWIQTGLPATIEGAVKSGRMAALAISG